MKLIPKPLYPEVINGYRFNHILPEKTKHRNYRLAIYVNARGKKAVAKIWNRNFFSINNYWLRNEIEIYKILSKMGSKYFCQKGFCVPKILYSKHNMSHTILLIEYFNGKPLSKYKTASLIKIYDKIFKSLRLINGGLNGFKKGIPTRTVYYMLCIYPYLLIRSIIRYPQAFNDYLKGLLFIAVNLSVIFKPRPLVFAHRDLGDENILLSKDKICVFDFQLSAVTDPLVEYVHLLIGAWKNQRFSLKYFHHMQQNKLLSDSDNRIIFKFLGIYAAILDIGTIPDSDIQTSLKFLKFINKYD